MAVSLDNRWYGNNGIWWEDQTPDKERGTVAVHTHDEVHSYPYESGDERAGILLKLVQAF